MTIPVFQESLITQNFGNPDKYYKKLRNYIKLIHEKLNEKKGSI